MSKELISREQLLKSLWRSKRDTILGMPVEHEWITIGGIARMIEECPDYDPDKDSEDDVISREDLYAQFRKMTSEMEHVDGHTQIDYDTVAYIIETCPTYLVKPQKIHTPKDTERLTQWVDYDDERYAIVNPKVRRNGDRRCLKKLARFEDLEDSKRLVELPCKVGNILSCVKDGNVIAVEVNRISWECEAENYGVFIREKIEGVTSQGLTVRIDSDEIGKEWIVL